MTNSLYRITKNIISDKIAFLQPLSADMLISGLHTIDH